MNSWKSFEQTVARSIRENSMIFLRRAADEIVGHDDSKDLPFDHETGTMVTVLTQMALELAIAAYLVQCEGIRSILERGNELTNAQIKEKWLENALRTKKFEQNKQLLSVKYAKLWTAFEGIVDMFQQSRNKIVHVHFHFHEADLYDLKFESTYVLTQVVSYFIFGNGYENEANLSRILSGSTFKKLLAFAPYQLSAKTAADRYTLPPLRCPICGEREFDGKELTCDACDYEHPYMTLLDCPECRAPGVIYDKLNLENNPSLPTSCLNCGDEREAARCKWCSEAFLVTSPSLYCSQDCIDDETSKLLSDKASMAATLPEP